MDSNVTKELLKAARKADKIDKERAELFQALVNSSGWKAYIELLDLRTQVFADAVLEPAMSVDQCIVSEGLKGTMRGLIIARDLPWVIIDAMKELKPSSDDEEPAT